MSTQDFKGSAHWFKELMAAAAKDIAEGGEVKAARVIHKGPNKARVHIGFFAAKVLRMRKRA